MRSAFALRERPCRLNLTVAHLVQPPRAPYPPGVLLRGMTDMGFMVVIRYAMALNRVNRGPTKCQMQALGPAFRLSRWPD